MPIVATAKGRRESARRSDVRVAVQDMAYMVRKLFIDASKRQLGETRRRGGIEVRFNIFRREIESRKQHKSAKQRFHPELIVI